MTRRFNAHFENGVLVPEQKVDLPERTVFSVTVDEPAPPPAPERGGIDDPNDPMPVGGVELVDWWARHRIKIDPATVSEIAENPEFDIENS